ncbi:hypothetical protein OAD98_00355 [Flavobacteriales bacterium]|nr:hypothetical protein [Flavobacteriales bacterium]
MGIFNKHLFNGTNLEKLLFLFLALFHLIPIVSYQFFPTLDGPAHLYNSNLINELLLNPNSNISQYFEFNSALITNFSGHFLLSFFNWFLPAFFAEKVFLVLYALGIPYSLRYLIKQINPTWIGLSYFSFPIIYSTVFLLGFYNFSIALVFFFFALGYWYKHQDNMTKFSRKLILAGLILLTLFSHLFVFAVLLLCLFLPVFFDFILIRINKTINFKSQWTKIKALAIVSFVPFLLLVYYFLSRPSSSKSSYLSLEQLTNNLMNMDCIIAFNASFEGSHASFILLSICILIFAKVGARIYSITQNKSSSSVFKKQDVWLVMAFVLLGMCFYLPNSNSFGGFISNRISLLFFLLLIVWLSTEKISKFILIPCVALMFYSSGNLVNYYKKTMFDLTQLATNCFETAEYIEEGSIVLPLNYSNEWNTGHYSNFLGIEKPMVILDNYEAVNDYFPVRWRPNSVPKPWGEPMANNSFNCLDLKNDKWQGLQIDYIFIIKNSQNNRVNCDEQYDGILKEDYSLVHENERCLLYRFNKSI